MPIPRQFTQERYLGDSVYGYFDGTSIVIYTSNGVDRSEEIVLEREVMQALEHFSAEIEELRARGEIE